LSDGAHSGQYLCVSCKALLEVSLTHIVKG
jgi:hypothetical protein